MHATTVGHPVEGVTTLTDQEQLFCALVASGISYRTAAEQAGWEKTYGWQKMNVPRIREHVQALAADPVERVRNGIEADIMMIRRRLAEGDVDGEERATLDLRLKACMNHAKLRGWIVDRKQTQRVSVDLSAISQEDMSAHLAGALDALEPGARREIEERLAKVGAQRRKAKGIAGRTVVIDVERRATDVAEAVDE
jgi:hypothetical protein